MAKEQSANQPLSQNEERDNNQLCPGGKYEAELIILLFFSRVLCDHASCEEPLMDFCCM